VMRAKCRPCHNHKMLPYSLSCSRSHNYCCDAGAQLPCHHVTEAPVLPALLPPCWALAAAPVWLTSCTCCSLSVSSRSMGEPASCPCSSLLHRRGWCRCATQQRKQGEQVQAARPVQLYMQVSCGLQLLCRVLQHSCFCYAQMLLYQIPSACCMLNTGVLLRA
jgi:hypothetical protein